ncbi:hypothetical protein G6F57_003800 [Rhizopus arrhizus]|uniref:Proline-rich protein PRCC n=1 Tax=Rhizopus oryzae TaxID=64495 RepID=A0A9P6XHP8_RHIOR|nr:hypothetical protein G6F24_001861 [Rhizopus arrhizus]KAG0795221.1 hypothetical protein G6F21_002280 [Rhizopus arrhizus]KAG0798839.1 hypothetical protein G6F22_003825 [Rhizopus arrhizus]KAG0819252.1 hypothetical protein G6F20_000905 [Rhizopus arrhizus]KAG0836688.1 hypothetical protein G6F19_004099 [Rhizopus arrhizus]
MSLVPDYSSDSETSDTEQPQKQQQPQKRSLSSLLPAPKAKKSVVYVDLPENVDEEESKPAKRAKTTSGFSLADLLPAPKNNTKPSPAVTDKLLTPHSLMKNLKEKKKEVVPKKEEKEEEEEEEEELPKKYTGSFFHIGKELIDEPIAENKPKPVQTTTGLVYTVEKPKEVTAVDAYEYDPNAMYSTDPSAYHYYQQQQQQQQEEEEYDEPEANGSLDDLQHIVGHRMRGDHNIQIKSVNQSDMLPSEEWRATHALTQAPKFDDGISLTASKLQLKKNNIMALAAHAINNREKLDNMFAEQKKTRRDAAKKYGF